MLILVATGHLAATQPPANRRLGTDDPPPPEVATDVAAPADAEPGYLGLVADDRAEQGRGIRVLNVLPEGPAAAAGLEPGDLITGINEQPIQSMQDFAAAMTPLGPGTEITVAVLKRGEARSLKVTLGRRPPAAERPYEEFGVIPPAAAGAMPPQDFVLRRRLLGLRTVPLAADVRRALGVPVEHGAVVVQVERGSPADQAGIPLDAVITAVDGRPVREPRDLAVAVEQAGPGQAIEIGYFVRGQLEKRNVTLRDYSAGAGTPGPVASDGRAGADVGGLRGAMPPGAAAAPSSAGRLEETVQRLEARLAELERRLSHLEQRFAPPAGNP